MLIVWGGILYTNGLLMLGEFFALPRLLRPFLLSLSCLIFFVLKAEGSLMYSSGGCAWGGSPLFLICSSLSLSLI